MVDSEIAFDSLPPGDIEQMAMHAAACALDQPIAIYEVHLPSWMRVPEEENRALTFFEIAPKLAEYVHSLNFTHVQLYAPGYTDVASLRFLVESLTKAGLGVILDTTKADDASMRALDDIQVDGTCVDGQTLLFGCEYQWDKVWAEETAAYLSTDPIYRKFRQAQFRHRDGYAFDANYILPLSRLLVSRPRQSLFATMAGDSWQKFANLRILFGYTYFLPGKKLVFMGNEFGQVNPWQPETSLDWHLLKTHGSHSALMNWVARLNKFYQNERALYETDSKASGFQWVDLSDASSSVISFLRRSVDRREVLLVVLNFTPVPRPNYRVGVPRGGIWNELLNSDSAEHGGSGMATIQNPEATAANWNFQSYSLTLTLPPLAVIVLKALVPNPSA